MVEKKLACWLKNDNPYGKTFDNRGNPCVTTGVTDRIVAICVLAVLALILIVISVGWTVRYSRARSRFNRFWQSTPEDYELKQHHQSLLRDDNMSVHSKATTATTGTGAQAFGRHGRSPLSTYVGDEHVHPASSEYTSTGYGDGGLGIRDYPSGSSHQPGGSAPWENYPSGASSSRVDLHAGSGERSAFMSNPSAMSSTASFGEADGLQGRLPDIHGRPGPSQSGPYGDPFAAGGR